MMRYNLYNTYVVGSSKNMTGGSLINSKAIDKRFLSPPDKQFVIVFFVFPKRNKSSISSIYVK